MTHRAGDAGARQPGQAAGGIPAERGHLLRARHHRVHPGPARGAADPRPGHHPGPAVHPRGRRLHPLVVGLDTWRAQRPAADRPVVGLRIPVRRRAAQRRARLARGAVAGDRGHRRPDRWYSFPAAWAVRGLVDRLAGGRHGAAAATPGICSPATPWISGGWRRSSRAHCCGCARR